MAKRTAQKQLTMDNFDQDDDDDSNGADAGPQLATEEVLKARPMAKARRRSDLNSSTAEEPKKAAFSGFGGFKGFATNTSQNPSFNAFKDITQMETNENTSKSSLPSTQTNGGKPVVNPKTESTVEDMTTEDAEDIYNNKLSELNKCFFQHINSYMTRSEFFDFTQVCKEYIEYHQKIELETNAEAVSTGSSNKIQVIPSSFMPSSSSFPSTQSTSSAPFQSSQLSFGTTSSSSSPKSPISSQSSTLFSSQTSTITTTEAQSVFAKPSIQFGVTTKTSRSTVTGTTSANDNTTEESDESPKVEHKELDSVFAKPSIQFGLTSKASGSTVTEKTSADDNATEENDEPPKVESVEHKEPDSVFSKRCKLFFKKGDEWSNKGVGFLYIKKEASSSSPAQLLIRADNKLGVILLHISLNDSLPISKAPQNKGVYLSCIPNPPLDPKATTQTSVTFLIKVKTEDTEQLFDALIKYKSNQ